VKEARRKERMETSLDTVAGIASQYFSATATNKNPKTVEYEKWLWTKHILPRMGRALKAAGIENATAHDLRRAGSSMMASPRYKISTEVISRVLNHTPASAPVTLVYNRYDYAEEKRAALQIRADV
jgi:integrase